MKANQHKLVIISIHVAVWLILFGINQLFLYNNDIEYDIAFSLGNTMLFIGVFYVTLFVLMPFLFKKQVLKFALLSLLLLLGGIASKQYFQIRHFEKNGPPDPNAFNREMPMPPPQGEFGNADIAFPDNTPPPPIGERDTNRKFRDNTPPPLQGEFGDTNRKFRDNAPRPPQGASGEADRQFLDNALPPGPGPRPGGMNRRMLLFSSSGIILFYAIGFSLAFVQKWQSDEKKRSNAEKERVKTELAFLKQQINPHFLFNSLNSIYSLAISQSPATTDSILKLSAILRYVLYESERGKITLSDEIKLIGDYIDLQKLRITNRVKVLFSVNGDMGSQKIEPFIIIPLIENAFKYGVDNVNESFIDIKLSLKQDELFVDIKNKVVPLEKEDQDSGIGLVNIERRLELLYSERYSFDWTQIDNIFSVSLYINLGV